ncbi:MAG: septum formation inhibitor Maf [Kaiparowitsia implicata GSE-PSE-MK54-09C]|jgi:septum formation protein|nr:septum formation inhibitor Maf [Kaiparowitsia implicata GSE-PSE-MK54-09C]
MMIPQFVLASASPARRRLLEQAGLQLVVCPSQFDEAQVACADPAELVSQLAEGKAQMVAPQFPQTLVLGCDSVLAIAGEIHGKPANSQEAIARWQQMRGAVGQLHTGHALIDTAQQRTLVRSRMTEVQFAEVSDRQIEAYVASGEPLNCAGCFALEGRGGALIEQIVGCYSNVIGLSLPLLRTMLSDLGYDVADFWDAQGLSTQA